MMTKMLYLFQFFFLVTLLRKCEATLEDGMFTDHNHGVVGPLTRSAYAEYAALEEDYKSKKRILDLKYLLKKDRDAEFGGAFFRPKRSVKTSVAREDLKTPFMTKSDACYINPTGDENLYMIFHDDGSVDFMSLASGITTAKYSSKGAKLKFLNSRFRINEDATILSGNIGTHPIYYTQVRARLLVTDDDDRYVCEPNSEASFKVPDTMQSLKSRLSISCTLHLRDNQVEYLFALKATSKAITYTLTKYKLSLKGRGAETLPKLNFYGDDLREEESGYLWRWTECPDVPFK